jgi:IclR family KDG regulon transcriptional repressor
MPTAFKRVPAIDRCFGILNLLAKSKDPVRISDISKALAYNKSTVFHMLYTLSDLGILESTPDNKYRLGHALYLLARAAGKGSGLIQTVHPFLERINEETKLSAFLGIRSGERAVILDKVDSAFDIRLSSEIGMRLPLLAGAGGKALLSQLSDKVVDDILRKQKLIQFTSRACVDKKRYKEMVNQVRKDGIALDDEEYIEGIFAFAIPVKTPMNETQAAIWAVGLKRQVPDDAVMRYADFIKEMGREIRSRFFVD